MTSAANTNWTPTAAPDSVDAGDGVRAGKFADRPAGDARGDGDTNGTTHHNYPDGWRVVNGGPTGHTESPTAETPQTTTPIVVPGPVDGDPVVVPAGNGADAAPEAPRRTVKDTLVDLYGNPLDAFGKAQPAIAERIAYAETAPWTKANGPLRTLGIAYNRAIANPGVATGYLFAEIHARPAHWFSTIALGVAWHYTMRDWGWHLTFGWIVSFLAWWIAVAVIAYVIGKRPSEPFGTDSEAGE